MALDSSHIVCVKLIPGSLRVGWNELAVTDQVAQILRVEAELPGQLWGTGHKTRVALGKSSR